MVPAPPWVAVPTPPGSQRVSLEDSAQGPGSAGGFPSAPHSPGTSPHLCVPSPPSVAFLSPLFPSSASSFLPSELHFSIFPCALRRPSSSSPSTASPVVWGLWPMLSIPPAPSSLRGFFPHGALPGHKARHRHGSRLAVAGGGGKGALPGEGVRELGKQAGARGAGHGHAEPAGSYPSPGASGFLPPSLPLSPKVPGNDGGPWGERLSGGGGARAGSTARRGEPSLLLRACRRRERFLHAG